MPPHHANGDARNVMADTATDAPAPLESDPAVSLSVEIADRLRNRIIHDDLPPGTRLQERQLASELHVSRTPLRNAFRILDSEGLVEFTPNYGARVIDYSLREIKEMLVVYTELDSFAGRLACQSATEEDFRHISEIVQCIEEAADRRDRRQYFSANQDFHLAIVSAARNPVLLEAHHLLNLRLYRLRYLTVLNTDTWIGTAREHASLLQTLVSRDADEMENRIKKHSATAWRFIEHGLTQERAPETA